MKKILFLTGVAVCALTLTTSCVKDNESASVTSLRDAKTEQIKAAAELAKAQAAAATLAAQADANLANAQAEVQKAQAEVQKAQAERQQLENAFREAEMDAEKAEIATRIAQAEADEAAAQQLLQNILNQIEMEKIKFEYDMAKFVADLEKQKADDAIDELNMAARAYQTAVSDLITAQTSLYNSKTGLANLEVSQAGWEESKAQNIATYKHNIARAQAAIEVYKQYANYTEDTEALRDKYDDLTNKSNKLWDDYYAAQDKYWNANNAVKHDGENAATKKLEENPFWQVFIDRAPITLSDGETTVSVLFEDTKANIWLQRYCDLIPKTVKINSYTDKDGNPQEFFKNYYEYKANPYIQIDGKIYGDLDKVSADVINMKIKEDKAHYTAEMKVRDDDLNAAKDAIKPLKDDAAAKLTALNALKVDAPGYPAAKTAYEDAVNAVNDQQAIIDAADRDVTDMANEIEAYNIIADFVVNYAENCKTVAALYDAVGEGIASDWKEVGEAWVAKEKAFEESNALQPEIDAIFAVLYGGNTMGANYLDQLIKTQENNIKHNQSMIDNYNLNIPSEEQTIETQKKNIALQEEYIKSLEVIANQRKAEYDAVLAKYQNAE